MLQREAWHGGRQHVVADLEMRTKTIRKSGLLDREVLTHELQIVAEHHFVCLVAAEHPTHDIAKLLNDSAERPTKNRTSYSFLRAYL